MRHIRLNVLVSLDRDSDGRKKKNQRGLLSDDHKQYFIIKCNKNKKKNDIKLRRLKYHYNYNKK